MARWGWSSSHPVVAERLAAQQLTGQPAGDPAGVAERLLAVQAQDKRGFRLAVRARTRGLTAADVDRALGDRSLLVTWLCRGTLHLVRAADYHWLHALTAPGQLVGVERRLGQQGVEPAAADRAVRAIEHALADEGPLTREQLRERIAATGVPTEGQVPIHLLGLASLRGLAVRGPVVDGRHAYVLVRDWLGEPPAFDRDAALAELARRYLTGHSPAGERDLARWAGVPLRDARAGLRAIGSAVRERDDGLLELAEGPHVRAGRASGSAADPPPPRLLGAFDPTVVGWSSREWLVGEHDARIISGGIFRPFAVAGGRAVANWRLRRDEVELEPFGELDPAAVAALEADAADVTRFLGAS